MTNFQLSINSQCLNNQFSNHFGHAQKGFTIPEIIVATAIALVLSGATVLFFARQPKQFSETITALGSQRQGERALRLMTRELRGASQGADTSAPLRNAQPDSLTFTADIDADGIAELVNYTATLFNLTRSVTKAEGSQYPQTPTSTSTLATSLTSTSIFRYPAPAIIEITLPLTSVRLEGTVLLRNLR